MHPLQIQARFQKVFLLGIVSALTLQEVNFLSHVMIFDIANNFLSDLSPIIVLPLLFTAGKSFQTEVWLSFAS